MDMQNWSGLTKLRPAFERLRHRLLSFRDEDGRELLDLPDAPRPDPETPAPVRLLGEYDNLLLGHANRRRIIPDDFPWERLLVPGHLANNLLVDGVLRATWWIEGDGKRRATLAIRPFRALSGAERDQVAEEARRMLDFASDAEVRDLRFEPAID
jgi:DNA glycosylase AlkZ-like